MFKVGFIGLGHMGHPMVVNLLRAGHAVKVFDVLPEVVDLLVKEGALGARSVAEVVDDMDYVVSMLQTGEQVLEVCLGSKGIFENMPKNALYIDSSSIDINVTHQLHTEAKKQGVAMVDAPVSGGVKGAKACTLTIMVGGDDEHFELAEKLLSDLGKKIIHAGPKGHGQAVKICNNMILATSMIAVCEAFNLGKKLGLDPKKFYEITSQASGQCWAMTGNCPVPDIIDDVPANHHYQAGFTAAMMLKDLNLSQKAAQSVSANTPLGVKSTALYQAFVDRDHGELDFSGIIKMLDGSFD